MSSPKSLLIRAVIDEAQRAHSCQRNPRHRIERGHKRLKVRKGRSWDHYCMPCAMEMMAHNTARLQELARAVEAASS